MLLGMSVRAEKGHSLYEDSWMLSRGRRGRVGGMAGGLPPPLHADTVLRGTVKNSSASGRQIWVQIPSVPSLGCVTLGQLLSLSEPLSSVNRIFPMGLPGGFFEIQHEAS